MNVGGLQGISLHFTCKLYFINGHSVECGPFKGVMNLLWPVRHACYNKYLANGENDSTYSIYITA